MIQTICLIIVASMANGTMTDTPRRALPPVKVWTHEDYRKGFNNFQAEKAKDPQWMAKLKGIYLEHMHRVYSVEKTLSKKQPLTNVEDARFLIDMLYEDLEDPTINGYLQGDVLDGINRLYRLHGFSDEVADAFRQGLLEYMAAGGGMSHPMPEGDLALSLAAFSGPAYPEINEKVAQWIAYTEKHAQDLQIPTITRMVKSDIGKAQAILRKKFQSQAELQKARSKADRVLRLLSEGKTLTAADIKRVALLATIDYGDPAANEDMIARLLIAYRKRLEHRKGLKKPLIQAIDQRLLWLADKKTRKLTSDRHWSLWSQAVGAIYRPVLSHDLNKFLHETEKHDKAAVIAKAAGRALRLLKKQ